MVSETTVENGTVKIPSTWEGATVYILDEGDTLLIKRVEKTTLAEMRSQLLNTGKSISKKDLDDAIKAARKSRPARGH